MVDETARALLSPVAAAGSRAPRRLLGEGRAAAAGGGGERAPASAGCPGEAGSARRARRRGERLGRALCSHPHPAPGLGRTPPSRPPPTHTPLPGPGQLRRPGRAPPPLPAGATCRDTRHPERAAGSAGRPPSPPPPSRPRPSLGRGMPAAPGFPKPPCPLPAQAARREPRGEGRISLTESTIARVCTTQPLGPPEIWAFRPGLGMMGEGMPIHWQETRWGERIPTLPSLLLR